VIFSQEIGIRFEKNLSFSAALEKSAKEGKLIFMDCYTSWCGPCKYLANKVFTQKEVGDFYNEHFINVAFDMEKGEGVEIAKKYFVNAYPTLLFLNSKGEIVHKSLGASEADRILTLGKNALDTGSTYLTLSERIKNGDRSVKTITNYLNNDPFASDKDSILNDYFNYCTQEERFSETGWNLLSLYIEDINHPFFKFFIQNRDVYETNYGKDAVKEKIKLTFDAMFWNNLVHDISSLKKLQAIDPIIYSENAVFYEFYTARNMFKDDIKNKEKWNYYMLKAKPYCTLITLDNMELNNIAWFVYENYKTFNDTVAFQIAAEWAKKCYETQPDNHYINDTYAHFLFDLGLKKEAIKHEKIAFQKAKAEGFEYAENYANELKKFKAKK